MILKYSVGCDISHKKFDACIVTIDNTQNTKVIRSRKFDNSRSGFRDFKIWYEKQLSKVEYPICFTMEATGVYHENLAHFLHQQAREVSIVLANHSNKYLESLGNKSKNDQIDSKGLARMGAERNLKRWNPPVEFYSTLRALTRHYQSLQEIKTAESNRLHAINASANKSRFVIKQLEKSIKQIEKQLNQTKIEIDIHIQSEENVSKKIDLVTSIKGVGLITAAVIVAETFGFELFENAKQLISYSGMDVVENQSGNRTGKTKISKKGNSRIRRALFLPAFCVVTNKVPVFYNLYCRTIDKHKIKMKSYVAVQKKILTTMYALWKREEIFDIEHYLSYQYIEKVAPNERKLHQVQTL